MYACILTMVMWGNTDRFGGFWCISICLNCRRGTNEGLLDSSGHGRYDTAIFRPIWPIGGRGGRQKVPKTTLVFCWPLGKIDRNRKKAIASPPHPSDHFPYQWRILSEQASQRALTDGNPQILNNFPEFSKSPYQSKRWPWGNIDRPWNIWNIRKTRIAPPSPPEHSQKTSG